MEAIQSKDNQRLKHAQQLKKKKFRTQYGEYLVEGIRSVQDMLSFGVVRYILVKESVMGESAYEGLLAEAGTYDVSVYAVKDSLIETIEDTVNGQGIIAVVAKKVYPLRDMKVQEDLYLLLDAIQDPGNLGTILRTAVAAGVKGIFLTKGSVDVYNDKTIRSTMSAITKIPVYEGVTLEDVAWLKQEKGLTMYGTALEDSESYATVSYKGPALLVMGNEGNGISEDILALCDKRIMIPLYGPMESLNIAIATGICIYKMRETIL